MVTILRIQAYCRIGEAKEVLIGLFQSASAKQSVPHRFMGCRAALPFGTRKGMA